MTLRGLLLAWAACAACAACAEHDVVVAEVAAPGDGGEDGEAGDSADAQPLAESGAPSCNTSEDCEPNAYCSRAACSDPTGTCILRPIVCDAGYDPHCGCDAVTYWNDCLRQRAGTTGATSGQCSVDPAPCGGPAPPCPVPGASCAHLVPPNGPCPQQFPGVCWLLPDTCPAGVPPGAWVQCGSAPPVCTDTCTAILSGAPSQGVPACP